MAGKIRAIVKRPDEQYGHMTNISASLENLQRIVGGPVQAVNFGTFLVLCNEEGKLRGLDRNFRMGVMPFSSQLVGTVIVIGQGGEDFADFTDVPIDFKVWKSLLKSWGN